MTVLPNLRRVPGGQTNTDSMRNSINSLIDQLKSGTLPGFTFTGTSTFSGPALFADGALALPLAWGYTSDTNTGGRHVSADYQTLVAGALDVLHAKIVSGSLVGVGVGVNPTHAFDVKQTLATDFIAVIEQLDSSAGTGGLKVKSAAAALSDPAFLVDTGGTTRFSVQGDGTLIGKGGQALQKVLPPVVASSALGLTTSFQDVPGCSMGLTLGEWMIEGSFYFGCGAVGDVGLAALGQLVTAGGAATITNQTSFAIAFLETNGHAYMATKSWRVTVTSATTAKLQAEKSGGVGTASTAAATHTTMAAWYMGNP